MLCWQIISSRQFANMAANLQQLSWSVLRIPQPVLQCTASSDQVPPEHRSALLYAMLSVLTYELSWLAIVLHLLPWKKESVQWFSFSALK